MEPGNLRLGEGNDWPSGKQNLLKDLGTAAFCFNFKLGPHANRRICPWPVMLEDSKLWTPKWLPVSGRGPDPPHVIPSSTSDKLYIPCRTILQRLVYNSSIDFEWFWQIQVKKGWTYRYWTLDFGKPFETAKTPRFDPSLLTVRPILMVGTGWAWGLARFGRPYDEYQYPISYSVSTIPAAACRPFFHIFI